MSDIDPVSIESDLETQARFEVTTEPLAAERTSVFHPSPRSPTPSSLLLSTFLSLVVVLVLLFALRYLLPSMLEFSRYSWYRGQLRAEYEMAGQQLKSVSLEGLNTISQTVAKRVSPSVVHIMMSSLDSPEMFGKEDGKPSTPSRRAKVGQGSGIVIDTLGHILTNFHVLDDGSQINVVLADERACVAELIGFDKLTDLAVLKIQADDLLPISWGDSDGVEVGSPVWAVGSPFGLTGSVTFGILSSKHRLDLSGTSYDDAMRNPLLRNSNQKPSPRYSDLMQSDVAVNPGNSGGPLVNSRGELVGVNTAIVGESYRGVSFSIPSNVVKNVLEQILESGKMRRGWLGVELVKASEWNKRVDDAEEISSKARLPVRGAVVKMLVRNSPAETAGLQIGDTILELNGQRVKGVEDLIFVIGKTTVGVSVQLLVEREMVQSKINVTVGERPDFP